MNFPDLYASPGWMPTFTALMAITLMTLLWCYTRCRASRGLRWLCASLKAGAVFLLCLCLLEPMTSFETPSPGANLFLILADSSQSLQIRDAGESETREEKLRQILVTDNAWQERLQAAFDLRRFTFARQLESSQFTTFDADGIGSSIPGSIDSVMQRYRGRPIAGIILLTDGNATDRAMETSEAGLDFDQMPPIYPVVVGKGNPEKDISITRHSVSQTNFEAAPVNIAAEFSTSGFSGKPIKAQLLDANNRVVAEKTIQNEPDQSMANVRFQVRPEASGVNVFRLRVADPNGMIAFDDPEALEEATMANNQRTILVDRARGPYRILYVSGRPNWEFKFLRRALAEDDEIDLAGLIRIAREEPKFTFRSHRNESTNSLFRGFGNERDEDAEQYDEPVMVRLGMKDANELRGGFPKSKEELFQYHAIVIDDIEASFFSEDQKSLINDFVSARGGGFLMLGGQESFTEGKYDRTPIGELLPVYIDKQASKPLNTDFRLQLTREGWLQPWVRLEPTELQEASRLDKMPGFLTVNPVGTVKPGASVLARVEDRMGDQLPALVAQRFGKGRSAALLIGDFWRWHFRNDIENEDLLKAWRQMMRWLVADVPRRVDVNAKQMEDANLSVRLAIDVYDEAFVPLDNAKVVATITRPDETEVVLDAEPLDHEAGKFGVTYVPRVAGAYRFSVTATAADGSTIGKRDSGWVSEPAASEFERLAPNREYLESLARKTGGQVLEMSQLDRFANKLKKKPAPVMETRIQPWWHNAGIFLLALSLLVMEWGLRRWKGLP